MGNKFGMKHYSVHKVVVKSQLREPQLNPLLEQSIKKYFILAYVCTNNAASNNS